MRALAVAILALATVLAFAGMWVGWRNRGRRQADMPQPPAPPPVLGADLVPPVEGVYVSTTTAGDWLDRVVAHGLGERSHAVLHVTAAGVSFDRQGRPALFVPAAFVRGVRREPGMAGKVVGPRGLLVITWEHAQRQYDSGFRLRHRGRADAVESAIGQLVTPGSAS